MARARMVLIVILALAAVASGAATAPASSATFLDAADPVKWLGDAAATPTASSASFADAAYPVKWNGKAAAPTTPPTTTAGSSSFQAQAYPVKWNGKDASPTTPPASSSSSFQAQAYPVKWNGKAASPTTPPASSSSSFQAQAYPVKWDGKTAIPHHVSAGSASNNGDTSPAHGGHGIHVEPGMLFLRKDLYPGAVLPAGTMLGAGNLTTPRFVFRKNADAVPFDYTRREDILQILGIPRGSPKAQQVVDTLRVCDEPAPREPHICATSQQAMLEFAAQALGTSDLRALVTVVRGEEATSRYVVASLARVGGGTTTAAVPCHRMPYPYAVFFCHRPSDVDVLRVELVRTGPQHDGDAAGRAGATAVAVCHWDTAMWNPRFFDILNATRGEPICHYMPANYVTWMRATA